MEALYRTLTKIRGEKPLIHHITNWVTISDCASTTRATGGWPVMAHALEEVEEMVSLARALVLNIGTPTPDLIESMLKAAEAANAKGIPVLLDAVGAGATRFRTDAAKSLVRDGKIDVLKGNAAEIASIHGVSAEIRQVNVCYLSEMAERMAKELSEATNSVVVISGEKDIVSSGRTTYAIYNKADLMNRMVGMGCMQSSAIACFCAVEDDFAKAAAGAITYFGICAEIAAERALGSGTFRGHFFDALENTDEKTFRVMDRSQKVSL